MILANFPDPSAPNIRKDKTKVETNSIKASFNN